MPLFSRVVSRISPEALRALRLRVFMDMPRLVRLLPPAGAVLDVGCGYGHVASGLAELRPDLTFHGIDPDPEAIAAARSAWRLPNLSFDQARIEQVAGEYAVVLIAHVLHHLPRVEDEPVLTIAAARLERGGRLVINEMRDGHCRFGEWLDRYVSGTPAMVRSDRQLRASLEPLFDVVAWETFRKGGMGQVLIEAAPRVEEVA